MRYDIGYEPRPRRVGRRVVRRPSPESREASGYGRDAYRPEGIDREAYGRAEYGRERYGGRGYGREEYVRQGHGRGAYGREAAPGAPLPPPDRRRPFPLEDRGYRGPGELGRYGGAPVPYGPDHTYDYHMGDRYGYGPDFLRGEERIRHRRLPELRPRRRRER